MIFGFADDLDKAGATLRFAGRAEALEDGSGQAAETALDDVIEKGQAAGGRTVKDEADLYRQKAALAFLRDRQASVRAYARATELDPQNGEVWNQFAALQLHIGEVDAAKRSYENVLALKNPAVDPLESAKAANGLAFIYTTRGSLEDAEAMYKKALEIHERLERNEEMAYAYSKLGNIYQMRGVLDEAATMLKRALDLYQLPGFENGIFSISKTLRRATAFQTLGDVQRRRGKHGEADAMYEKARAFGVLRRNIERTEPCPLGCFWLLTAP